MIPATRWAACREAARKMSPLRSLASCSRRRDQSKQGLTSHSLLSPSRALKAEQAQANQQQGFTEQQPWA